MKIKSQKILALMTAITIILSFMPTFVFAGTGDYISVADVSANSGEDIIVEVKTVTALSLGSMGLDVKFDKTALSTTASDVTIASAIAASTVKSISKSGDTVKIQFAVADPVDVAAGTTLASIKFSDLKVGTSNISTYIDIEDASFDADETVKSTVTVLAAAVVDTGITLNKNSLTLTEGQSEKLIATVEPPEATDKTVTWSSNNTDAATVDTEGNVTAVAPGNATITARSAAGNEATCAVTVTPAACTHSNMRTVAAKEPTCTVEGNNEYKVCDDCGKVFKADGTTETTIAEETIAALGHDFSVDNHDEHQHWKECSRCHIADTKIDHKGEGEYQSDATHHWKVCGCGVVVEKEAHTGGEAQIENSVPATCAEAGSHDEVVYCTVCGYKMSTEHKVDEAKGHTPKDPVEENVNPATCTEAGSHDEVVYCEDCNAEISREHKTDPALGHNPGEPVEENKIPATHTSEGSYDEVVYCTRCHAEISRIPKTISVIPHDVENVPWSHDEHQHWKECGCGTKVDVADHTGADPVNENINAPTCTAAGSHDEVVYCSVCEYEMSRTTKTDAAKGHTPGEAVTENVVEPTCTKAGSHDEVVYCDECHEEVSRTPKTDAALGHNPGEAVTENVVEPTCTKTGSHDEVVYCTRCHEEISRTPKTDAALGHNPGEAVTENVVEPTCTAAGSHDEVVYCTRCHEEISRTPKTDAALGHDPADPVRENEVEATVESEGSYDEVVYCNRCHAELSRTPKTTPRFVYEITDGEESEHKENTNDGLTIKTNGKKGKLEKVLVDGEEVPEDAYTLGDGDKAEITLKPEYLNKLPKGTHKISLVFDDGELNTNFDIVANNKPSTPKTGDPSNLALWIGGLVVSGILFVVIVRCKARSQRKRSRH